MVTPCFGPPKIAAHRLTNTRAQIRADRIMIRAAASLIAFLLTAPVGSETVDVSDRGTIDLATFECRDINRSSLVQRVCYDSAQRTLIVGIKGSYDDYCDLPQQT